MLLRNLRSSQLRKNLGISVRVYQRQRDIRASSNTSNVCHELTSENVPKLDGPSILLPPATVPPLLDGTKRRNPDSVRSRAKSDSNAEADPRTEEGRQHAMSRLKQLAEHFKYVHGSCVTTLQLSCVCVSLCVYFCVCVCMYVCLRVCMHVCVRRTWCFRICWRYRVCLLLSDRHFSSSFRVWLVACSAVDSEELEEGSPVKWVTLDPTGTVHLP